MGLQRADKNRPVRPGARHKLIINGLIISLLMLNLSLTSAFALAQPPQQIGSLAAVSARDVPLVAPEEGIETLPEDIRLVGLLDRRDVVIPVPLNWSLNPGSFIEIKMNHSPLLIGQTSNLTVLVNNQPANSTRLDNTNINENIWRVNFPANVQPDKGRLIISFTARQRINELLCPPAEERASWTVIAANSKVHLEYNETAPASVANLSDIFLSSSRMTDRRLVLVVPENPSARDLTRASQVITRLGSLAGPTGLDISLSYGVRPTQGVNQIIIGGPSLFPLLSGLSLPVPLSGQSFVENNLLVPADNGVVQLAGISPVNLIVSGLNDDAVDRATQALLDDRSLGLMRGLYSLVQPSSQFVPVSATARNSKASVLNGRNSFSSLSFETQAVSGLGVQDAYYTFTIPAFNTVSGDGKIKIDYSYTGVVDPKRSSLSVILNDVLLQGVPLDNYAPQNGTASASNTAGAVPAAALATGPNAALNAFSINVNLPKGVLRNGDNRLVLRYALFLANNTPCSENTNFNDVWGAIYNTSELTVQTTPTTARTTTLSQLPYPFAGGSQGSLIVLPELPHPAELRLAAQLAAELGRNEPPGQFSRIKIAGVKQVTPEQLAQNNVVLVGTPETNSLTSEASPKLPVAWNSSTARRLSTERGLRFASVDAGLAALIQIAPSPWSEQNTLLSVASEPSKTDDGKYLVAALGRRLYIGRYTGNALAIDTRGKLYPFSTQDVTPPEPSPAAEASTPAATAVAAAVNVAPPATTAASTTASSAAAIIASSPAEASDNRSRLLGLGLLGGLGVLLVGGAGLYMFQRYRASQSRSSKRK